MHQGWWSSTMHSRSRNLTTYIKQCIGARPHKGGRGKRGGNLQLATQTKIYKLQTSSTNKHCAWKCKIRSKQTKGKEVGQVLLTFRGDGEVSEVCRHTPPCAHTHAPITCTRECIGIRSHKGESKNSKRKPTQDNTQEQN
jgi:hypothetical protein